MAQSVEASSSEHTINRSDRLIMPLGRRIQLPLWTRVTK